MLHKKYRLPVYPVVLLSYDKPLRPEPDRYLIDFPDIRVLDFAFRTIQLNRLDWRQFLRNANPVAAALMTKMHIEPNDRPKVRAECLRMIATLKLDKARSALIGTFMDSYLRLTAVEIAVYNRELAAIAPKLRGKIMKMTNSWVEKGREEGLAEGEAKGQRELIIRQLRGRFGRLPAGLADRVRGLSDSQVDRFSGAIFDIEDANDAALWLDRHSRPNGKAKA